MKQEKKYEILKFETGEIVVAISQKSGFPEKPFIIHDGSEHAIFYRSENDVILLDFINENVLDDFSKSMKINIAEVNFEENTIISEYQVPIKKVKEYAFQQIQKIKDKYKK